jgi:hypothetical protein
VLAQKQQIGEKTGERARVCAQVFAISLVDTVFRTPQSVIAFGEIVALGLVSGDDLRFSGIDRRGGVLLLLAWVSFAAVLKRSWLSSISLLCYNVRMANRKRGVGYAGGTPKKVKEIGKEASS